MPINHNTEFRKKMGIADRDYTREEKPPSVERQLSDMMIGGITGAAVMAVLGLIGLIVLVALIL